ncbi:MAG: sensor domain-containing diguanylate cyclase [bacterium]|nr:sensor domain-containing diguanylate cyclase [bacterium]
MTTSPRRREIDNVIEQSYRSLVENIQDYAIFMLDKNGCIISWDQGARRQLGYTRNEVVGKNFSIFFTPTDISKGIPKNDLKRAFEKGRVLDEREYVRKDGRHYWSTGVLTSTIDLTKNHLGYSKIMRDITEQKDLQKTVLHRSTHDYLTGLPNREFFEEILLKSMHGEGGKNLLAIFFLDFNNFKLVNDEEGHRVGDMLLIEIAARLTKSIRISDIAARLGGDEFVVLLRSFEKIKDIEKFARKILKIFEPEVIVGKKRIKTSVSVGVAIYPNDGKKAGDLLHNADTALYQSKKKGGNQYNFYQDIKGLKEDLGVSKKR